MPPMKSRILVLHSGPSGCECANGVAGKLYDDCHEVIVADLSRFLASHILAERALLVCLDNSRKAPSEEVLDFVDFLSSLEIGSLAGLKYSVLSVDQATRGRWQDFGRQIDALLEMLGARRLARRMHCRVPLADHLQDWAETISTVLAIKRDSAPVY